MNERQIYWGLVLISHYQYVLPIEFIILPPVNYYEDFVEYADQEEYSEEFIISKRFENMNRINKMF